MTSILFGLAIGLSFMQLFVAWIVAVGVYQIGSLLIGG